MKGKRKICFVITSRVHYARSQSLLDLLRNHPALELQIIVGGSALLPKYGDVTSALEKQGYEINERLYTVVEGGDHIAMAKTTGLTILEFTNAFQKLDPDIVVIRGDRFEMLASAIAAAYMNKTLAHVEGGDVSGSIDESVRHAITKLSHYHFVTNARSLERVLRMGERPDTAFNTGSLEVEFAIKAPEIPTASITEALDHVGIGSHVDLSKPFLMVIQHPVTSGEELSAKSVEDEQFRHANATLEAVGGQELQTLWFWPNIDAGTDALSKAIRVYREKAQPKHIRFIKNLDPAIFINLLRRTACLVGNSSAGIKECSYLGVPVVDVGDRQNRRFSGPHMVNTGYDAQAIRRAVSAQVRHGKYTANPFYYQAEPSRRIAELLSTLPLYTQKIFHD